MLSICGAWVWMFIYTSILISFFLQFRTKKRRSDMLHELSKVFSIVKVEIV